MSAASNSLSVSPNTMNNLLVMLSPDSMETSFTTLIAKLHQIATRPDAFKIGLCLLQMMRQSDLLVTSSQQLTALVFLFELFRSVPFSQNPFVKVFMEYLNFEEVSAPENPIWRSNKAERNFISLLVTGKGKDLLGKSPKYISTLPSLPEGETADLAGISYTLTQRLSQMPDTSVSGIPVVISDPSESAAFSGNSLKNMKDVVDKLLSDDAPFNSFQLQPERPIPPLWLDEEAINWVDPIDYDHMTFRYDSSVCEQKEASTEARRLMSKAKRGPLTLSQQHYMKNEFDRDPSIIQHIGLSPSELPNLVENNPLIAIEVLCKLIGCPQVSEYFQVLVNMDMSLHSMEVVNRLTTLVELPPFFIYLYISNCISTCEAIKDKYMQNRLVRLLCVFLQSLIRNKIINIQEIFIEVQAFCIDFSRIREAAALFRLLKQLESGETPSATDPPLTSITSLQSAAAAAAATTSTLGAAQISSPNIEPSKD